MEMKNRRNWRVDVSVLGQLLPRPVGSFPARSQRDAGIRALHGRLRFLDRNAPGCDPARPRGGEFLERTLALTAKASVQINRSARGITVCGYRILPGSIRLGRRRKRRYLESRRRCEAAYQAGTIDAAQLQARPRRGPGDHGPCRNPGLVSRAGLGQDWSRLAG